MLFEVFACPLVKTDGIGFFHKGLSHLRIDNPVISAQVHQAEQVE